LYKPKLDKSQDFILKYMFIILKYMFIILKYVYYIKVCLLY